MTGALTAPLDIAPLDAVIETLRVSYTMQAQHAIHHAVAGGAVLVVENERPAIELF